MEIKGCVHCFFEQSGTFKNEFKKLGYQAYDYDIQNNFGETDHLEDLFQAIEDAYGNKPSIFDNITNNDLVVAFFPCIYFTGSNNPLYFRLDCINYRCLTLKQKLDTMLKRSKDRQYLYELVIKLVGICLQRNIRLIIENPYDDSMHYLKNNFFKNPTIYDRNRRLRGDYFTKPTGYWFFNCEPTQGKTTQNDKKPKIIRECKGSGVNGLCSEERSMISPDYARNFICDFILGQKQNIGQLQLL